MMCLISRKMGKLLSVTALYHIYIVIVKLRSYARDTAVKKTLTFTRENSECTFVKELSELTQ